MKSIIRKDEAAVSPVIATILMVAITVVLAAVLYVMVSGLLVGPGTAPQLIGVTKSESPSNWVLQITSVPSAHALTTTTFVMRWAGNLSVVVPPGQATLQALKTTTGGVTYSPISGAAQTDLRNADIITISKTCCSYVTGMQISILDGTSLIWSGNL